MYNRLLLEQAEIYRLRTFHIEVWLILYFTEGKLKIHKSFSKVERIKTKRRTVLPCRHTSKNIFSASLPLENLGGRKRRFIYKITFSAVRPPLLLSACLPGYFFHNETPSVSTAPNSAGYSSVSTIWKGVNISAPLLPLFPSAFLFS